MQSRCLKSPPTYRGVREEHAPSTLGPEARMLYRHIELYAARVGIEPPTLLSQCRSADQQAAMQAAWDRGDRAGMRSRPANPENSKHVPDENGICYAFDLGNTKAWLNEVGPWVARTVPDARWGGNFLPRDEPHFDVEPQIKWSSAATFTI